MKKRSVLSLFLIALFIAACASQGNRSLAGATEQNVSDNIEVGTTTKGDVKAAYGSPLSIDFIDAGNEVWKYRFGKAHVTGKSFIPIYGAFAGGAKGQMKELTVLFDTQGIVRKFAFTDSAIESRYNH
jgi:outer membrane protein assembly factor BamE (lipoprotein component of BamABCDE complex)